MSTEAPLKTGGFGGTSPPLTPLDAGASGELQVTAVGALA